MQEVERRSEQQTEAFPSTGRKEDGDDGDAGDSAAGLKADALVRGKNTIKEVFGEGKSLADAAEAVGNAMALPGTQSFER